MRELAGSMGDYGILFPFFIGYIAVCGIDAAGLLVAIGLANIATGIFFRLPIPVEPMKVIAIVAIAQRWSPEMVFACGFATGIIWLILSITGLMQWIGRVTPNSVVLGIQAALGIMLCFEAAKMITHGWVLAALAVVIIMVFKNSRFTPAAVLLIGFGCLIMYFQGNIKEMLFFEPALPVFALFKYEHIWSTLLLAGFAQIPLTATNAVISTKALIRNYWQDRDVSEKQLSLSTGIINSASPFLGGAPMCHGAGGLAGQYFFGARTGGANIIEGVIEILLGLFLASSVMILFSNFPVAIIGAMLFAPGVKLLMLAKGASRGLDIYILLITASVSIFTNMALGFAAGVLCYYLFKIIKKRYNSCL